MRGLWSKPIFDEGRGHHGDEGRVQVGHGGLTVLGSIHLLPHLDSPLRAHCRATIWLAKEREEVGMARGAFRSSTKAKRNVDGGTSSSEGNIREGVPGFRYGGYESDWNRVGDKPRGQRRDTILHPI